MPLLPVRLSSSTVRCLQRRQIFPLFSSLTKGLTVRGYTLFEITGDAEKLARGKQYVYDSLQSGALKPIIDRTFPLDAIIEAHQYMESNQQKGKIVVTV